jgi:hypothetical protein
MNAENQKKLRAMRDKIIDSLNRAKGFSNYEEAIALIREIVRDKTTSPAPFLHRWARELYPVTPPDTVEPESFYEILGLIDTTEKLDATLAGMPDESYHMIEVFLQWVWNECLPAMKADAQKTAKGLPQYHRGGPKHTKMPDDDLCLVIWNEILEEYRLTGVMGEADRNVALKRRLTLRMIQRIKATAKQLLKKR